MLIIYLLLGIFVIKVGIDNSRSTQLSKEILNELKEIKELMIRNKYEWILYKGGGEWKWKLDLYL